MTNCSTCLYNTVCKNVRVATEVVCDYYIPTCKACKFWNHGDMNATQGYCKYMTEHTLSDDFCSIGEAKENYI